MTWENLKPQYSTYNHYTINDLWHQLGANHNPFLEHTPEYQQYQDKVNSVLSEKVKSLLKSTSELKVTKNPSKRRMPQPVFKPFYETLSDIRMRLERTLIFVGSQLYYVREVLADPAENDFVLRLMDKDGTYWYIYYDKCHEIDLRTPEPQYITYRREPLFFLRPPLRQQQQGLGPSNFCCAKVGSGEKIRTDDYSVLMTALSTDILPFSTNYYELIDRGVLPSLRLSKDLAIYRRKNKTMAEYRGRFLGDMDGNTVLLDKHDFTKPWIRRAIENVACKPEAK